MAYDIDYALIEPVRPTDDGSDMVIHVVDVVYRIEGSTGDREEVPHRQEQTIYVPAGMLEKALASGGDTAIADAYKLLLQDSVGLKPEDYAVTGWYEPDIQLLLANNDHAAVVAGDAHQWILTVRPDYPPAYFDL